MQKSEARLKMSDVFDRRVAPVLEKLRQGQQVSESEVSSAVELLIKDTFEVNTASQHKTIDVVIEDPEGNCIAAIEVKSPRNTAEMITSTDFNKKALHQISRRRVGSGREGKRQKSVSRPSFKALAFRRQLCPADEEHIGVFLSLPVGLRHDAWCLCRIRHVSARRPALPASDNLARTA